MIAEIVFSGRHAHVVKQDTKEAHQSDIASAIAKIMWKGINRMNQSFNNKPTLKPCPFCGAMPGKIETTMTNEGGKFRMTRLLVVCTGCGIEFDIDTFWSCEDAVDKWNRRTRETE